MTSPGVILPPCCRSYCCAFAAGLLIPCVKDAMSTANAPSLHILSLSFASQAGHTVPTLFRISASAAATNDQSYACILQGFKHLERVHQMVRQSNMYQSWTISVANQVGSAVARYCVSLQAASQDVNVQCPHGQHRRIRLKQTGSLTDYPAFHIFIGEEEQQSLQRCAKTRYL
jgi:hypothetical protein